MTVRAHRIPPAMAAGNLRVSECQAIKLYKKKILSRISDLDSLYHRDGRAGVEMHRRVVMIPGRPPTSIAKI